MQRESEMRMRTRRRYRTRRSGPSGGTGPLRVLLEASVLVVNADDLVVVIPRTFLVMGRSAADAQ